MTTAVPYEDVAAVARLESPRNGREIGLGLRAALDAITIGTLVGLRQMTRSDPGDRLIDAHLVFAKRSRR